MSDLFAVFVVVHAGQRAVGIPVDVRVHPTRVPVTGPAHITLETHTHITHCFQFEITTVMNNIQSSIHVDSQLYLHTNPNLSKHINKYKISQAF